MNGDQKNQHWYDKCAGQSLPRMKGHCGPRGWGAAFMVDGMRRFKPEWTVHQAMRPIEPGIVRKEIKEHGDWQVPERKRVHIAVNLRPAKAVPTPSHNSGRDAVNGGARKAPTNLALYLLIEAVIEPRLLDFSRPCKSAADEQIAHADDRSHCGC